MILEEVIMLARTVPEPSKKYGVKVCSVAYSPELKQLIRMYPIMPRERMPNRHCFRVKLKRNDFDSRPESFKKVSHTVLDRVFSKTELEVIFDALAIEDISTLNERKKSLGIIMAKADEYSTSMKSKKDIADPAQMCLFQKPDLSRGILTGPDYKHIPYINIPSQTKQKNLQIRTWGLYELIRKNDGVISDKYLGGVFNDNDLYLVIGNMNGCRSVWIVCSYYKFKAVRQRMLPWTTNT